MEAEGYLPPDPPENEGDAYPPLRFTDDARVTHDVRFDRGLPSRGRGGGGRGGSGRGRGTGNRTLYDPDNPQKPSELEHPDVTTDYQLQAPMSSRSHDSDHYESRRGYHAPHSARLAPPRGDGQNYAGYTDMSSAGVSRPDLPHTSYFDHGESSNVTHCALWCYCACLGAALIGSSVCERTDVPLFCAVCL